MTSTRNDGITMMKDANQGTHKNIPKKVEYETDITVRTAQPPKPDRFISAVDYIVRSLLLFSQ